MIAPGAADRLPGLAHCLGCDRAGIDHDEIVLARQHCAHPLALGDIHAAAKADNLRSVHA
jgi:hypothetical protein